MDPERLRQLVTVYEAELVAMDAISVASDVRAKRWNNHVDRLQRVHIELRESAEGRAAITAMILHPVQMVARWSASHSLFWAETEARTYLESLADARVEGSLEAKMVLREFDAGRLRMDWEPRTQRFGVS